MLRQLSGGVHCVVTSVCLIGPRGKAKFEDVRSEVTRVCFQTLSEDEIRGYVATGEPMDKAGAYAIQGIAARWIPRIEGCYFNVVGLPISLVYRMLQEHSALKIRLVVQFPPGSANFLHRTNTGKLSNSNNTNNFLAGFLLIPFVAYLSIPGQYA